MHRGGVGADSRYSTLALAPSRLRPFKFSESDERHSCFNSSAKEPLTCPQYGSASRIGRSLCLSCLLAQGLRARVSPHQSEETLEDVLGELDMRDAEWRVGDYQILE